MPTERPLFGCRFCGSVDYFYYTDDRLRPTWKRPKGYRLTPEHRHQLCVHQAAHAVISSMGGSHVYMLAVAPAGSRSWTITERKGRSLGKLWGHCSVSDYYCDQMFFDEDSQKMVVDRPLWTWQIEHGCSAEKIAYRRRAVRALACGYLAGHIADGITAGMGAEEALRLYDRRPEQFVGVSDIVTAQGLCELLADGEYENAVRVTEDALRHPEMWAAVHRLASDLEAFGLLENSECEPPILQNFPMPEGHWPSGPKDITS